MAIKVDRHNQVTCKECTITFLAVLKTRKYCSQKCADKYRYKQKPKTKKLIKGYSSSCFYKKCKNTVYYFPRHIKSGAKRFCSMQCTRLNLLTNDKTKCVICKNLFYCSKSQIRLRNRKTCSVKCRGIFQTQQAEKRNFINPPTKGVLNRRLRYSKKMSEWRIAVFERDNYTCRFCGAKSGKGVKVILNADHIKPFAYYPELRFDINNGRTLCLPCHKETPTYGNGAKIYAQK